MIVVVQILLVIAVLVFSLILLRDSGSDKRMAIRRILVLIFAVVAIVSIFFPDILTQIANFVGIGRGTDLVLYGLVVTFLVYMATTHQRFKQTESMITRLARRIAIDEAESPREAHARITGETRE
ncbi:DUF2304 domain-containing protein [Haematomicrobium sanguinis]|uniref:DUF2304 domain-containing protein n=1 Tax=Haematomicrobium sanguinis TaxID=479106 RepID=UPI0004793133|nr:DUF2304 domain-containing protein [Haematomicrobium sanguinis]